MSLRNGKGWAMATATLIVQWPFDAAEHIHGTVAEFERAIDETEVLRRTGTATRRDTESVTQAQCEVVYGPIHASGRDLERHLERQLKEIRNRLSAADHGVFDVVVRELPTPKDLEAVIAEIKQKADDIGESLASRKRYSNVVARLRNGKNAGRVPRL